MTDNTTGWELLSAWPGGTVSALATTDGPGGHGAAITLAATAAGLHVSRDGGQTWRWIALGPAPVTDALAVSPRFEADRTVLIGTNAGLHRSTDGGLTWRAVLADSRVQCIAATPDFADGGMVLVGTEADGVLRSEDGGLSWDGGSAGLLDLNVTALALSPTFGRDRTAFAGAASGLYRSRNGGRAWRLVEIGLEVAAIQALA
ncbi:MAG: WD40/YVTN/BNR-like repeat-containing protein, partial [Chloroflexota bacterium]